MRSVIRADELIESDESKRFGQDRYRVNAAGCFEQHRLQSGSDEYAAWTIAGCSKGLNHVNSRQIAAKIVVGDQYVRVKVCADLDRSAPRLGAPNLPPSSLAPTLKDFDCIQFIVDNQDAPWLWVVHDCILCISIRV
jgi:hypothetical protein